LIVNRLRTLKKAKPLKAVIERTGSAGGWFSPLVAYLQEREPATLLCHEKVGKFMVLVPPKVSGRKKNCSRIHLAPQFKRDTTHLLTGSVVVRESLEEKDVLSLWALTGLWYTVREKREVKSGGTTGRWGSGE